MALSRLLINGASIFLLAGGIVLQFFIILSGVTETLPVNLVYFLQANTDGITGGGDRSDLPNPVRWTYFALCGEDNGHNSNCYGPTPALPFDPTRNFQTEQGVPDAFIGGNQYYYLSRFAWVFYLIALVFAVVAFLLSVFALCARLGSYLTGLVTAVAFFFQTLAAALMTAWTVKARNAFNSNGGDARLGRYAFGFTWATFVCWLLATVLFCLGGRVGKSERDTKTSYFGRKRSTRSRGSFRDSSSQRRVKDEYE